MEPPIAHARQPFFAQWVRAVLLVLDILPGSWLVERSFEASNQQPVSYERIAPGHW